MTDVPTQIPGLTEAAIKAAKPPETILTGDIHKIGKSDLPAPGMDLNRVAVKAIPAPPFS